MHIQANSHTHTNHFRVGSLHWQHAISDAGHSVGPQSSTRQTLRESLSSAPPSVLSRSHPVRCSPTALAQPGLLMNSSEELANADAQALPQTCDISLQWQGLGIRMLVASGKLLRQKRWETTMVGAFSGRGLIGPRLRGLSRSGASALGMHDHLELLSLVRG